MSVSIRKNGFANLLNVLENAAHEIPAQAALETAALAKELAPQDSGHLKSRIHATEDGAVLSEATYSAEVEFGTSNTPAHPFLTPAAHAAASRIADIAKQIIPH